MPLRPLPTSVILGSGPNHTDSFLRLQWEWRPEWRQQLWLQRVIVLQHRLTWRLWHRLRRQLFIPRQTRRLLITVKLQLTWVQPELQWSCQLLPVLTGWLQSEHRAQHELPVQIKAQAACPSQPSAPLPPTCLGRLSLHITSCHVHWASAHPSTLLTLPRFEVWWSLGPVP